MDEATVERWLNYRAAARTGKTLSGVVPLDGLERVRDLAESGRDGAAETWLTVFEDDQRWARVTGRVECALRLQCARCLEPVDFDLATSVEVVVTASDDAAANAPRDVEPVLADGEWLDVHALIEDEMILALPVSVRCDRADCREMHDNEDRAGANGERQYPFAGLAAWPNRDRE